MSASSGQKKIHPRYDLTDPKVLKELAFRDDVTIYLDHDNSSEEAKMGSYASLSKNNTLVIVTSILEKKNKPLLLEIIKEVFERGDLIWRQDEEQSLEDYLEYSASNSSDKNILDFFKDIISTDDYNALKMSLYLRNQKEKGRDIAGYKKDIRDRYGRRGINIANLCSEGYFETEFIPLYNQVSKVEFAEYYERAVGKRTRALFIHHNMTPEEIDYEFDKMIDKAYQYHISFFTIHARGQENLLVLKRFVANKKPNEHQNFTIKKVYEYPEVIGFNVFVNLTDD